MRTDGGLDGGRTIKVIDYKAGIMNKTPIFIRNGKLSRSRQMAARHGARQHLRLSMAPLLCLKTWIGFRELLLNDERNSSNFGTTRPGEDKSVHQVQAVEVAPGKVLVSAGQLLQRHCGTLLLQSPGGPSTDSSSRQCAT